MANQSAKKRVEDNRKRISLLFYIILGSAGAHILIRLILLRGSATRWTYITALGSLGTQLFLFSSLRSMATPTYSMRGELLDGGVDLKMAGVCEYMQDIIYLLALAQLLGMLTSWAWLLMLVVPAFAFYMLWTGIISPWWNAPPPQEMEETPEMRKKREKLERKMARQQRTGYR